MTSVSLLRVLNEFVKRGREEHSILLRFDNKKRLVLMITSSSHDFRVESLMCNELRNILLLSLEVCYKFWTLGEVSEQEREREEK